MPHIPISKDRLDDIDLLIHQRDHWALLSEEVRMDTYRGLADTVPELVEEVRILQSLADHLGRYKQAYISKTAALKECEADNASFMKKNVVLRAELDQLKSRLGKEA